MRVTPRGGADRVEGVAPDGELRVRVRAAPADGAANEAVVRLLAKELGLPPSALAIERGASSRTKRVALTGLAKSDLTTRWPGLLVS